MMNIILIVSDTFRRDHLGCYGNPWISTPNLDRLASRSCIFDRAYTGSFPTVPARTDLLTGRYSFTYCDWQPLSPKETVIAEVLGRAGYTTMLIADTPHILQSGYHFDRGFTGWEWIRGQENDRLVTDPVDAPLPCAPHKLRSPDETVRQYLQNVSERRYEEDYFVARTMSRASRWLEKNARNPFFLYVDTFDPHEPWDPPRYYTDLYDPGYTGEEVIYPAYGPADYLTDAELKHMRALYAGEATLVDRWAGALLRKAEDMGILDNTAVIFTTDHGFYLGEHGLIGKGIIRDGTFQTVPLYPEMAHIPLLISVPGGPQGRRTGAFAQFADLMPTILELTGAPDPGSLHGHSLVPILEGKKRSVRPFAVSSWSIIHGPASGRQSTITTDEWALICGGGAEAGQPAHTTAVVDSIARSERPAGKGGMALFHLPSDPGQTRNVAAEYPEIARKIHERYIAFLKSVKTPKEYVRWRKLHEM
ncbi:MAG: sulfatase [Armatimonadetes bacterium]|nr:sulfatase [Armatimonadota bacterium]